MRRARRNVARVQRSLIFTAFMVALLAAAIAVTDPRASRSAPASPPAPTAATSPPATPSPPPSPSPSPTPTPVTGEAAVEVVDANRTERLHVATPVATDDAAVDVFVADVTRWLDDHLTALQRGEPGNLDGSAVLDDAPEELVAAITTDLAGPDDAVAVARYTIEVAVAGQPLWATTVVEVTHGGGHAAAELVFAPGAGGPDVVAAAPLDPAETPA